jgi:hypothetical protein
MYLILKTDWELISLLGQKEHTPVEEKITIPKGTYEVEEIKNPYYPTIGNNWLILKSPEKLGIKGVDKYTKIGASKKFLHQLGDTADGSGKKLYWPVQIIEGGLPKTKKKKEER